MTPSTPILDCSSYESIKIQPSAGPSHPYQSPRFDIPPDLLPHLDVASSHLRASRTVAFPTETVYGLGASSIDPLAIRRIYEIKNRPSDNPLIIHVSSLDMLQRLLPPTYTQSRLYRALISAFWPGPLTLLFPSPDPPPVPAPQTNAIRMPSHPLSLALIHHSDLPLSAPSANSSGRPSPTCAQHVYNDLNGKEGLGCILDGGECVVGVESTVVNGLGWKEGGGGYVDVLRPGGLGVEEIERIVREVDGTSDKREERTRILVHGQPWRKNAEASASRLTLPQINGDAPPSTPGLKYRHYSPRVPVYLVLPSSTFGRPHDGSASPFKPVEMLQQVASRICKSGQTRTIRFGLLHYDGSPLRIALQASSQDISIVPVSLGRDSISAAHRLFSGLLQLEAPGSDTKDESPGVDAILVEGCTDEALGLAVMERINKAVGGGGATNSELNNGDSGDERRFWMDVGEQ